MKVKKFETWLSKEELKKFQPLFNALNKDKWNPETNKKGGIFIQIYENGLADCLYIPSNKVKELGDITIKLAKEAEYL